MSLSDLRVGIIGCGNMARNHARFLLKQVQPGNVAVCDQDPLRLSEFAVAMGLSKTFRDLDVMLAEFKPDVVHIVTPPGSHRDLAVRCMSKQAHVLIEKPMCLSTEEADDIIAASRQYDRLVAVDHMRSFDPMIKKAKALVASGALGRIVHVSAAYSYDYLQRIDTDSAARWINRLPGGCFFDLMPHLLCLFVDFLPGAQLAHSKLTRNREGIVTDLSCLLTSPAGDGYLHMSLNIVPLKNYIELECEKGTIRVDLRNFLFTVRRHHGLPNAVERIVENLSLGFQIIGGSLGSVAGFLGGRLDPYAGLDQIIRDFLHSVATRGESPVPPQPVRQMIALTEAIFGTKYSAADRSRPEIRPPLNPCDALVTGGTGFIGRRLVNRLLESGQKVRIFSHRSLTSEDLLKLYGREVECVRGNIYDPADVTHACQGVKTVYHLAAAMKGDWNYNLDTTITGTRNMVKAAKEAGVARFVYASTLNVYDARRYPNRKMIDEQFAYEPQPQKRGAYSQAKLQAEKEVLAFDPGPGMTVVTIRPGLVYGPGGRSLPQDVAIRAGKRALVVLGMGMRKIPFVYVDNLVDAFMAAGTCAEGGKDAVFNIVDPEYPSQRHYIRQYRKLTGEKVFVFYVPFWMVYSGFWVLERLLALLMKKKVALCYKLACISRSPRHSTRRAEAVLKWKPKVAFADGLRMTVAQE